MTHVRVKRLGPVTARKTDPSTTKAEEPWAKQKSQAMDRIESEKDAWRIADMARPRLDYQKKNRHDGPKKAATPRGARAFAPKRAEPE